jgi:hypothetical protein
MVAGCGASCLKFIFFAFNFLVFVSTVLLFIIVYNEKTNTTFYFQVCGGAILGLALWARLDDNFQYAINLALKDGAKYPLEIQNVSSFWSVRLFYITIAVIINSCRRHGSLTVASA